MALLYTEPAVRHASRIVSGTFRWSGMLRSRGCHDTFVATPGCHAAPECETIESCQSQKCWAVKDQDS